MTAPRPVFPGSIITIQRRCTQRQFLLRPDDDTLAGPAAPPRIDASVATR